MIFLHRPTLLRDDKWLDGRLHDEDQDVEQGDQHPENEPVLPAQLAQTTCVTDLSVIITQVFVLIRAVSWHSEDK